MTTERQAIKAREEQLSRMAEELGLQLSKSTFRKPRMAISDGEWHRPLYLLRDQRTEVCVSPYWSMSGPPNQHGLTLDDVEEWLTEKKWTGEMVYPRPEREDGGPLIEITTNHAVRLEINDHFNRKRYEYLKAKYGEDAAKEMERRSGHHW